MPCGHAPPPEARLRVSSAARLVDLSEAQLRRLADADIVGTIHTAAGRLICPHCVEQFAAQRAQRRAHQNGSPA